MAIASSGFGIFYILYICFIGLCFCGIILFIKLATRGIKALDIYINEKNNKSSL